MKENCKFIIKSILLIASIVFICKEIISIDFVVGCSMEPTLKDGDITVYNRLAYIQNDVQRGDIILFETDEVEDFVVKRVIGVPGDVISFKDGSVFINNEMLDESAYIPHNVKTNSEKQFVVPEDCYFVLGDNREKSLDSREFENPYIPRSDIQGKYLNFRISFLYLKKPLFFWKI